MNWLSPILSEHEERRRKWREAQRRHREGKSMSRKRAIALASKYNPNHDRRL